MVFVAFSFVEDNVIVLGDAAEIVDQVLFDLVVDDLAAVFDREYEVVVQLER